MTSKTTRLPNVIRGLDNVDKYPQLRRVIKAKTNTRRRVESATVQDKTAAELSACEKPSEMARIAMQHGISSGQIVSVAGRCPNFGQFRMVVGNMVRAAQTREQRAETPKPARKKISKKVAKKAATRG